MGLNARLAACAAITAVAQMPSLALADIPDGPSPAYLIMFEPRSTEPLAEHKAIIDGLAKWVRRYQDTDALNWWRICGRADLEGQEAGMGYLAKRRERWLKSYLRKAGATHARLTREGCPPPDPSEHGQRLMAVYVNHFYRERPE